MCKKLTSILMMFFVFGGLPFAQAQDLPMNQQPAEPIEVSDDELEEFIDVYMGVAELNQQFEMQVQQVLQEEGLEVEKFMEIQQSEQMGASREDIDATPEELEKFDAAMEAVQEMEGEFQEEIEEHVEEEGMDIDRYEEIMMGLQQDQQLMQRAQQMIQERQGMPQQQQQQPPH